MESKPSNSSVRHTLLLIWWVAFALNAAALLHLYAQDELELEDLLPAIKTLNALYVPYLGAITAYYWGTRSGGTDHAATSRTGNRLAITGSILWNGMILFFILRLLFLIGTLEESLAAAENIGGIFVWLVAPALGYYFATSGASSK